VDYSITLKKEIGGTCGTNTKQEKFRWEVLRGRGHLKDLDISERIILKGFGLI